MTALWIIPGAALLLLAAGLGMLHFVCVRHTEPDYTQPEVLRASKYAQYADEMLQGVRLVQAGAQDVYLRSFDGLRLHAQLLQTPGAKGTILLFHGYRSSWVIDFSIVIPYYVSLGYNLLIADERAHGRSEGRYITFGVRERRDVVTWAQYAAMHFGAAHPLILGGLSMGAATVLMASELPLPPSVRGVIADCGFSSPYEIMKSVLQAHATWLPPAPLLALLDAFTRIFAGFSLREASAADAAGKTVLPILFIHGTDDHFVPHAMTQTAYDACTSPKQLVLVTGAGHGCSYLVDRPQVQAALRSFLSEHTS